MYNDKICDLTGKNIEGTGKKKWTGMYNMS